MTTVQPSETTTPPTTTADAGSDDNAEGGPRLIPRPPALVAVAAWLVPGGGYWLIGLRARALTVGVAVVTMFVLGLLIGGVRVIEVPFFDRQGGRLDEGIAHELRAKPWSIAQVMAGPIAFAGGAGSVWASIPGPDGRQAGGESHARLNDIAVLYTAVAGMLNLLAVIDSATRAGKLQVTS